MPSSSRLLIFLLLFLPSGGRESASAIAQTPSILKPIATMDENRAGHTATLLADGGVLIAGGFKKAANGRDQIYSQTAEIFDPRTRGFSATGEMTYRRTGHTATLLRNGLVLIAGGFAEMGTLSSAELYDPANKSFTPIGNMSIRRGGLTATILLDGRVLLCGGGDREAPASAEIYDPMTKKFTPTGNMTVPRNAHTATRLPGGLVLIVGGSSRRYAVLASSEIYNPATGRFIATANMEVMRYKHGATQNNDGDVLVFGGSDDRDWRGKLVSVERYAFATGKFIKLPDLQRARFKLPNALVGFEDGTILVAGGNAALELYSPATGSSSIVGSLDNPYYYSTATVLHGDSVLIAGGYDDQLRATNKAWIWSK